MGMYGSGLYGAGVYSGTTALTLTVQDTYPDRVLASAVMLASGQVVSITRRVTGSAIRTPVRGGDNVDMTTDTLVRADAEAPYGLELTYYLTVDDVDLDSELVTLTLSGGQVALSDAISGDSAEVVILSWPEKNRARNSSVYSVGGRNIVVSGQQSGFTGSLELYTETEDAMNSLLDLLRTATSGIVQIRQPGGYGGVDAYVAVLAANEQRWSQDGSDERRTHVLDVVEVTGWAPGFESTTFTWEDVYNAYTGQTYADLAGDFSSYLDLALGDFSA